MTAGPRSWTALLAALVALAWLGGCGPARKDEVPTARFRDDARLRRGQVVFMQQCNQCHVGGGPGLGPGLNDKPLPALAIKTQVRQGVGTMPAFATEELSDEDLDALVDYLYARRQQPASAVAKK